MFISVFLKSIVVVLYYVLLSIAYICLNNAGLLYLDIYKVNFSISSALTSVVLLAVLLLVLPTRTTTVSDYFLWLLAAFPLIPMLVFYSFSGGYFEFLVACMMSYLLIRFLPSINFPIFTQGIALGNPIAWAWVGLLAGFAYIFLSGDYGGLDYSLDHIYENRKAITESQAGLFEYVHPIIGKAVLPFLLIRYVMDKNVTAVLITLAFSVALYLLTQHRAALMIPALSLVCYLGANAVRQRGGIVLLGMLCCIIFIGILLLFNEFTIFLGDVILRRPFIAPAILNNVYYEFFLDNPHTFFSDSKISLGLAKSVYPVQVPYLISDYVGLPGGHANTGYLGAGYQQAGFVGMFIYSLFIGILMRFFDVLGKRIGNPPFVFAIVAPGIFWLFTSSDLPGVFLTHGLLVSLLLMVITIAYQRNHVVRVKRIVGSKQ